MITKNKKSKSADIIVGLDIGSYSVKSVVVVLTKDGIEVQRFVDAPLSQDKRIEDVLSAMDLSSYKHVRTAVSGPSVIIRRIKMPLMTPAELKGAIRFEAEAHIPFPIDDCVLDYQVLSQDAQKKEMSIILVAAKKEFVDARYKTLSDLKIFPEMIDLDIFCLINAFESLNSEKIDKCYALLNIGHKMSSFAIIQDGQPFFVREIARGGYQVTKALAALKAIPEDQADQLKIVKSAEDAEALKSATKTGFESLSEEIRNSVDFAESEIGEGVSKIYLSGGGALALDAAAYLTQEIGRSVQLWDNTAKMSFSEGLDQKLISGRWAELNVVLGMALRGMAKK